MPKLFRQLFPVATALFVACVAAVLVGVFFQNTTSRILVQGYFSHDTEVIVSTVSKAGHLSRLDSFEFKGSRNKKAQYHGTRLMNLPTSTVQLDFIHKGQPNSAAEASIRLTSIQIFKPYMNRYYFSDVYIDENFFALDPKLGSARQLSYLANGKHTAIRSKSAVGATNWALVTLIPVMFFIGVLVLMRHISWGGIPAFADMSLGNKLSSSSEFNSINGIRGLAAVLVLLSHTAPGFESVQMGLSLLFVISGFLLAKPFVMDSNKIFNFATLERYIVKRLKRILPMYYTYIFIMYVITLKFDTALRHFFFVQAEGHLWPMTQIFAFYMMLPLVLLITCATHRIHRLLPLALLGIAVYLSITQMNEWQPFYNGAFSHNFALYAFLMGVFASYLQYDLIGTKTIQPCGRRWQREALGLIAIIFTFLAIAWSAPMKPAPIIFTWISQFWVKCLLSVGIILLTINLPKTIFNSLMSNPIFRSVGVIGFSFYILHGLGIEVFKQFELQYLGNPSAGARTWEFFAGAFAFTYVMAVVAYSYVERPFFGYRVNAK